MLTISQIAAPINALPSGSLRFRAASLCPRHILHGSQRTQAVPPRRYALQPFPPEILRPVGLLLLEPRRRNHRRIYQLILIRH